MVTELDRELPNIIAQAQAGEVAAFSEIYTRYAGLVLRYLYGRLREPEIAQDLTQEVFVRVLKGISSFEYRGEKSFLGWLYTIAGNVLIGQVRRKHPIATPLDDGLELADPHGQEAVHAIFDRIALRQAIDQLTEDQQQVLTLKFFADMTNNEIAQAIGRTEGAVKALQHRALAALQQILEQESSEFHARATRSTNSAAGGSDVSKTGTKSRRNGVLRGPLDGLAADGSMDLLERAHGVREPYRGS